METKYFSKLLPLENGFKRVVKNAQGIPIDYKYEMGMFLCTRDGIQAGDKFYHTFQNKYFSCIDISQYEDIQIIGTVGNTTSFPPSEYLIKVVGQIFTPGIIEGQEFKEEEFAIIGTDSSGIICQISEEDLKNGYHVVRIEIKDRFPK
jgi:hypothetical protein